MDVSLAALIVAAHVQPTSFRLHWCELVACCLGTKGFIGKFLAMARDGS